jgi:hypothetical protein
LKTWLKFGGRTSKFVYNTIHWTLSHQGANPPVFVVPIHLHEATQGTFRGCAKSPIIEKSLSDTPQNLPYI